MFDPAQTPTGQVLQNQAETNQPHTLASLAPAEHLAAAGQRVQAAAAARHADRTVGCVAATAAHQLVGALHAVPCCAGADISQQVAAAALAPHCSLARLVGATHQQPAAASDDRCVAPAAADRHCRPCARWQRHLAPSCSRQLHDRQAAGPCRIAACAPHLAAAAQQRRVVFTAGCSCGQPHGSCSCRVYNL